MYYVILALRLDLVGLVDLTVRTAGHVSVTEQTLTLNKESGCSSPGSVQLSSGLFPTVPKPWPEFVLSFQIVSLH